MYTTIFATRLTERKTELTFEDDVVFEYHITIQDEDFNLGILTMKTPEGVFEADFDAE